MRAFISFLMASIEPTYVQLGPRKWQLGGEYLKHLEPCNTCLNAEDVGEALRQQLNEKGYIYLQRVLPEVDVLQARTAGSTVELDRKIDSFSFLIQFWNIWISFIRVVVSHNQYSILPIGMVYSLMVVM